MSRSDVPPVGFGTFSLTVTLYTSSNQAIAISKSNNPLNMCLFITLFNYWTAGVSLTRRDLPYQRSQPSVRHFVTQRADCVCDNAPMEGLVQRTSLCDFEKTRLVFTEVHNSCAMHRFELCMLTLVFAGWSRDLVRETIKKCNMVSVNVFIFGFTPFVLSEAILFISIFWGLIHFVSSPFFSFQESLFLPDPCELTYGNTLLLSNAAVSLGSAYSTRENLILFGTPNSLSFILACILAFLFLLLIQIF